MAIRQGAAAAAARRRWMLRKVGLLASSFLLAYAGDSPDMTCSGSSPLAGSWQYLGCWTDSADRRVLAAQMSLARDDLTVECCQSWCERLGYPVAGLEYGRECYCGSVPPGSSPSKACYTPCQASPTETCGGPSAISVYVNPSLPPVTNPTYVQPTCASFSPAQGWWSHVGCYEDNWNRLLPAQKIDQQDVTVDCCLGWCQSMGYPFAGLEGGSQCFCGAALPRNANTSVNCNIACVGGRSQNCGGLWGLDVYVYAITTAVSDMSSTSRVPTSARLTSTTTSPWTTIATTAARSGAGRSSGRVVFAAAFVPSVTFFTSFI